MGLGTLSCRNHPSVLTVGPDDNGVKQNRTVDREAQALTQSSACTSVESTGTLLSESLEV